MPAPCARPARASRQAFPLLTDAKIQAKTAHGGRPFLILVAGGRRELSWFGVQSSQNCSARLLMLWTYKPMSDTHEVTSLLTEWAEGDTQALEQLTPLVYTRLRQLAASYLRKERRSHTLQPTALVHEAYLRLVDQTSPSWQNRSHFYGVASRLMRQILVDDARRRHAGKRMGSSMKVSLDKSLGFQKERPEDLLALDISLSALEKIDARKCKAVELRYFGGLSLDEIAQALDVSVITVRRDLKMAEAWLQREMQ